MQKRTLRFPSDDGDCAAWLILPPGSEPAPVIVMAHGLGATRDMGLLPFAERFVTAGYACLIFDYRHFGDSSGEPRQLLDIPRQLADWRAAIAFARGCKEVDGHRLILWGTSFAGGHVLVTAASDHAVAAVIAQCPFTDGLASSLVMNPLTALRLSARALADQAGSLLGRPPLLVATAGKPDDLALMTAPDVWTGYLPLVPAPPKKTTFRNEVAARIVLGILRHAPGRYIGDIASPTLLCVCDNDSVAPADATLRHARKGRSVEARRYATGHFDIYAGAWFERVVADQLAFIQRHVPLQGRR